MNSELLNKIGLDSVDPAYFLIGLMVVCVGLLIYIIVTRSRLKTVEKRLNRLTKGRNAKSLEEIIVERFEQIDELVRRGEERDRQIEEIEDNLLETFQKTGIVKYDAFNEMGGKLSFALALLDNNDTGFVINAMHSREGCYTYIKEIIKGESYIVLGDEEKEAVEIAKSKYEV